MGRWQKSDLMPYSSRGQGGASSPCGVFKSEKRQRKWRGTATVKQMKETETVSVNQSGFTVRRLGFKSLNMRRIIHSLFAKLDSYRYKRKVCRALALYIRGEVRRDGLQLT